MELEKGSSTSFCMGHWFWKRLWTGRKTKYPTARRKEGRKEGKKEGKKEGRK